ncbi:MAG: hypothetical protein GDA49_05150 [Rhodospirillales bacterium]|nr:hypothetical protein [Rhodospirillales bacterium]
MSDPITVVEEVTSTQGVVLIVRGLGPHSGNPIPTAHPAGFAIRKIVINATGRTWNRYDIQLQKSFGTPSDLYDGLSFGQMSEAGRPFPSDGFAQSAIFEEPSDSLSFFDGVVEPDEAVAMTFVITATGPVPEFFVLQQPNHPIAQLLSPGGRPVRIDPPAPRNGTDSSLLSSSRILPTRPGLDGQRPDRALRPGA